MVVFAGQLPMLGSAGMGRATTGANEMYERYEVAPHYDCWMQGDQYGSEVRTEKSKDGRLIRVLRMERSGKTRKFWADETFPR